MKVAHLSDLHLGIHLNGYNLIEDQKYILDQILEKLVEEKTEVLIIAGDVYDNSVPASEPITLFDDFLYKLKQNDIKTLIISGNHDSNERLSFGNRLLDDSGIYISPIFDGTVKKVVLSDEYGNINFYLMPFIKPITVKPFYPDSEIKTYNDAVKVVLDNISLNKEERNILVAHQFVTGAATSESETFSVGGLDNISLDLFDDFDYVALGHIHKPQYMGNGKKVRYCGTPLKYSFSEYDQQKSITFIDVKSKGEMDFTYSDLKPLHEMVRIKGSYDELKNKSYYDKLDLEDYYEITLTDETDVYGAADCLSNIYKNYMTIKYDRKTANIIGNDEMTKDDIKDKKPIELLKEFYKFMNNKELSEEQLNICNDIFDSLEGSKK